MINAHLDTLEELRLRGAYQKELVMKMKVVLGFACAVLFSMSAQCQVSKSIAQHVGTTYQPLMIVESCSALAPTGYLLSYRRDVTFCGGQRSYVYESYIDKPVGAYMDVCQQTLPAGWVLASVHTGYTVCDPKQYWNIQRIY